MVERNTTDGATQLKRWEFKGPPCAVATGVTGQDARRRGPGMRRVGLSIGQHRFLSFPMDCRGVRIFDLGGREIRSAEFAPGALPGGRIEIPGSAGSGLFLAEFL